MKRIAPVLSTMFALLFIALAPHPAHGQADGKTYTYAIINSEGKASPTDEFVKKFIKLLFKRIGAEVNVVLVSPQAAAKGIADGTINFSMITHADYIAYRAKKVRMTSVLTLNQGTHTNEYRCIALPKGVNYTGLQSLRGKSFVAPWNIADYVGLRWYMESQGVKEPLDKFFGPMVKTVGQNSAMADLATGKIDASLVSIGGYTTLQHFNTGLAKKLQLVECHELPWPPQPVVWFGVPDADKLQKFYKVLAGFDPATDPDFKPFMPLVRSLKLKIYLVTDKDYKSLLKVFDESTKKGWDDEFQRITTKAKPL